MDSLSYKNVQRLSMCCQTFRELASFEFKRRRNGIMTHFSMFEIRKRMSKYPGSIFHPSDLAVSVPVHMTSKSAQQEAAEIFENLRFSPKIALLFCGNLSNANQRKWCQWFKDLMPNDCTFILAKSEDSVCGSVDEYVFHQRVEFGNGSMAHLLFASDAKDYDIKLFKNMNDLISITSAKSQAKSNEQVKCILYFSKLDSLTQLLSILAICKERNDNINIAFGGLVVDSLASIISEKYTSELECAGLVFTGSVKAASTVIQVMDNHKVRDAMISFRNSIEFDITDKTQNTICFLLSCVEHSPFAQCRRPGSIFTESEGDIFHTIFPSNVKAYGLSGHGEFGHVSGGSDRITMFYYYSCVMVLVQFPKK